MQVSSHKTSQCGLFHSDVNDSGTINTMPPWRWLYPKLIWKLVGIRRFRSKSFWVSHLGDTNQKPKQTTAQSKWTGTPHSDKTMVYKNTYTCSLVKLYMNDIWIYMSVTLPWKHVLNILFTQELLLYTWLQIYGNDIFLEIKLAHCQSYCAGAA